MTRTGLQFSLRPPTSTLYARTGVSTAHIPCRYYVLSAACALFQYTENRLNARYAACSLLIRYVQLEGTMMITSETAHNLELVGNAARKRSAHSLFG